jgi:hypothetical protein
MFDDRGQRITEAGPSMPAKVMGLEAVPDAGVAGVALVNADWDLPSDIIGQAVDQLADGLDENPFADLVDGRLAYSRDDSDEEPENATELRRVIETRLPRIRIEDLLVDVDRWCGFTRELTPLGGYRPRVENVYPALLAGRPRVIEGPGEFEIAGTSIIGVTTYRGKEKTPESGKNVAYVIAPAQFGRHNERRESYGHSLIVDPWGEVQALQEVGEGVVMAELDVARLAEVRAQLPALTHRRVSFS